MSKKKTTLKNLKNSFKRDLKKNIGISNDLTKKQVKDKIKTISNYADFNKELKNAIMISGMSLEEQKVETIAIIEEEKHRNFSNGMAILISLIAIIISFFTFLYSIYIEDTLKIVQENVTVDNLILYYEKVFQVIFFIAIFVGIAYLCAYAAITHQNKSYKKISFFTLKLECIKQLEKEQQKKINKCRKIKCKMRLKK